MSDPNAVKETPNVQPAKGKLGVLIPGMGAVMTTVIAGVEAVRRGLAAPVGSVTQLGTIRLGKRTDNNSPRIKDFVPLADLNDLEFGCWDIYEDDAYSAAVHAGVLERPMLDQESDAAITALIDADHYRDTLAVALKQLPDGLRDAVALRVIDELSYEAVAARLGCSPAAARTRVHRGLARLNAEIEEIP